MVSVSVTSTAQPGYTSPVTYNGKTYYAQPGTESAAVTALGRGTCNINPPLVTQQQQAAALPQPTSYGNNPSGESGIFPHQSEGYSRVVYGNRTWVVPTDRAQSLFDTVRANPAAVPNYDTNIYGESEYGGTKIIMPKEAIRSLNAGFGDPGYEAARQLAVSTWKVQTGGTSAYGGNAGGGSVVSSGGTIFIAPKKNIADVSADAAKLRPNWYDTNQIGDQKSDTIATALQTMSMFGMADPSYVTNKEYAKAASLESLRQVYSNGGTTETKKSQYYSNELQKLVSQPIEQASEYHYLSKITGVPTPANPWEYQADLAVELLKGAPTKASEMFSPVSGQMAAVLPGGSLGIQQLAWNTALNTDNPAAYAKPDVVSFMPALGFWASAKGQYGPYGGLFGGPSYVGTPSSDGLRKQPEFTFTDEIKSSVIAGLRMSDSERRSTANGGGTLSFISGMNVPQELKPLSSIGFAGEPVLASLPKPFVSKPGIVPISISGMGSATVMRPSDIDLEVTRLFGGGIISGGLIAISDFWLGGRSTLETKAGVPRYGEKSVEVGKPEIIPGGFVTTTTTTQNKITDVTTTQKPINSGFGFMQSDLSNRLYSGYGSLFGLTGEKAKLALGSNAMITQGIANKAPTPLNMQLAMGTAQIKESFDKPYEAATNVAIGALFAGGASLVEGAYAGSRSIAAGKIISEGGTWRGAEQFGGFVMKNAPKALATLYTADVASRSTKGFTDFSPAMVTRAGLIGMNEALPMIAGFGIPKAAARDIRLSDISYKSALQEGNTGGRIDYYVKQPARAAYEYASTPLTRARLEFPQFVEESGGSMPKGIAKYMGYKIGMENPVTPEISRNYHPYEGIEKIAYPKTEPRITPEVNRNYYPFEGIEKIAYPKGEGWNIRGAIGEKAINTYAKGWEVVQAAKTPRITFESMLQEHGPVIDTTNLIRPSAEISQINQLSTFRYPEGVAPEGTPKTKLSLWGATPGITAPTRKLTGEQSPIKSVETKSKGGSLVLRAEEVPASGIKEVIPYVQAKVFGMPEYPRGPSPIQKRNQYAIEEETQYYRLPPGMVSPGPKQETRWSIFAIPDVVSKSKSQIGSIAAVPALTEWGVRKNAFVLAPVSDFTNRNIMDVTTTQRNRQTQVPVQKQNTLQKQLTSTSQKSTFTQVPKIDIFKTPLPTTTGLPMLSGFGGGGASGSSGRKWKRPYREVIPLQRMLLDGKYITPRAPKVSKQEQRMRAEYIQPQPQRRAARAAPVISKSVSLPVIPRASTRRAYVPTAELTRAIPKRGRKTRGLRLW